MNNKAYVLLNLTNSFHFIVTQSLLSLTLSFMLNSSVLVFTLFTGLYLTFLGFSCLFLDSDKIKLDKKKIHKILIANTITSWILILLIPLYLNYHSQLNDPLINTMFLIIGAINSIVLGFCSGIELPLYTHLNKSKFTVNILVSDYYGSALGMLFFNFILYPFLGINGSIIFSLSISLIGLSYFVYCLYKTTKEDSVGHLEQ